GERARRRRLTALAFAAVVAALAFGAGTRVAGDGFDARRAIAMRPTVNAPGASAVIRLGAPDASGNWALRLEVEGLPKLPEDGYYVLWLARGREYGATCGSFSVGRREASAEWTVSYPLQRFDRWVVTAWLPGQKTGDEAPWLLMADVPADVGPPGAQGATRPAATNAS
ncbi:MAG: hypothetical protein ICV74_09905, partial [Thermoleophilia bacterium]|nr:hypothetical protein [Thermoleophilia bacterium]